MVKWFRVSVAHFTRKFARTRTANVRKPFQQQKEIANSFQFAWKRLAASGKCVTSQMIILILSIAAIN